MDLEGKCPKGNTPLHLAAKCDNWEVVRHLLLQGASIHSPDSEGVFVIQRLAMYSDYHERHRDILKHLIKIGADLKVRCTNGDSLLHLGAKANNWLFVFHIILEKISLDLDELDSDGFNILHRLAQDDKGSEWVEEFFMFGVNLDTPSSELGHGQDFVQCGAQVNELDPGGYTVLHRLAKTENPSQSFLSLLIEKGVRCDIMSAQGETICEIIAENENWEMMKILLTHGLVDKGVDINTISTHGESALELAVKSSNWPVVDFLLSKGAQVNSWRIWNSYM
ncbi:uncharacterized protein LOC112558715 [Pomacea canaliculata]|uniref:uncharacterized protein LOC112558715 n=1 Tax=Pomacea canaliculata TaxID=400727 RepID=UPI000D72545F|nr:uncharacterized protein LOC112558715 [Pomacea canaliculata]